MHLGLRGVCLRLKKQPVALRPRVPALARDAQSLLRVVERALRTIVPPFQHPRAPAQHERVRVHQPHPARRGERQCLTSACERTLSLPVRKGKLTVSNVQADEVEYELTAVEGCFGSAKFSFCGFESAFGQRAPAQHPVTAGYIFVPFSILADV